MEHRSIVAIVDEKHCVQFAGANAQQHRSRA
jgi:hypothetical protein